MPDPTPLLLRLLDPREVTQSIDSDAGLNHRFGWGTLSATANRRQFLSDDRVELEFPRVSLSMSTITLFPAPSNRAGFFNNMTLSASGQPMQSSATTAQSAGRSSDRARIGSSDSASPLTDST